MQACRPEGGTRSHYRWLWATMWLLGIELRTFRWAGSTLNHWAISPALYFNFLKDLSLLVFIVSSIPPYLLLFNYYLNILYLFTLYVPIWLQNLIQLDSIALGTAGVHSTGYSWSPWINWFWCFLFAGILWWLHCCESTFVFPQYFGLLSGMKGKDFQNKLIKSKLIHQVTGVREN